MRVFVFFVALLFIAPWLSGQGYLMEHLTMEAGLSADQIQDIEQDSAGFIWLLSTKGVTRYDGTDFTHYPVELLGNEEFKGSAGRALYSDPEGGIWLTTFAGAVLSYDPFLDAFHVKNDSLNRLPAPAYSTYRDTAGIFWFGTAGKGLVRWNPQTKRLTQYQAFDHPDSLSDNFISQIYPVNDSLIYLTTTKGSNILNPRTGRFYRLWFNSSDGEPYKHNVLRSSLRHGKYTYTASYHGLHIMNMQTNDIKHLTALTTGSSTINHNSLWEIVADHQDKVWIATYGGGVNILDPVTGEFSYLTKENSDLPENNILGIFRDREGNIWLRTATSGLVKINFNKGWVRQIDFRKYGWPEMTDGIFETDSILWIATNGGGLIRYDLQSNTFRQYVHDKDDPYSLAYDHLTSLDMDSKGRIWIATGGAGMDMFNPSTQIFSHFPYRRNDEGVSNAALSRVHCVGDKVYYVTYGNGFGIYNTGAGHFISYQSGEDTGTICDIRQTRLIKTDSRGNELVASDQGLIMRPAGSEKFQDIIHSGQTETPLSSFDIVYLNEKEKGEFVLLNAAGELMEFTLDEKGHLVNGNIVARGLGKNIIKMSENEIWSVENDGLLRTRMTTGEGRHYDHKDGLLGKEFYPLPRTTASQALLASISGLNLLDLRHPPRPVTTPSVRLYELSVLNRGVSILQEDSVHQLSLNSHLHYTEQIDLEYGHKEFTIEFGALQFYSPGAAIYRYRLIGFRDEWVEAGSHHRASYTNLDPGNYTFQVQAGLLPGEWGPVKSLSIRIAPPFWMTRWFMALVVLAAGGLLYLLHSHQVQKAVALANLRTQIAQDLHDDIGSSLTKISLYSSLLADEKDNAFANQIGSLSREVIIQMSDIVWSVDHKNDALGDLVIRMRSFAIETLTKAGIQIEFEINMADERVVLNPLVRQNYYLLFKEAINNICKHSKASYVRVKLEQKQAHLLMEISDDGVGIQADNSSGSEQARGYPDSTGNGLRNMKKRAERLGVSFRVESSGSSGTTIRVGTPA